MPRHSCRSLTLDTKSCWTRTVTYCKLWNSIWRAGRRGGGGGGRYLLALVARQYPVHIRLDYTE